MKKVVIVIACLILLFSVFITSLLVYNTQQYNEKYFDSAKSKQETLARNLK